MKRKIHSSCRYLFLGLVLRKLTQKQVFWLCVLGLLVWMLIGILAPLGLSKGL